MNKPSLLEARAVYIYRRIMLPIAILGSTALLVVLLYRAGLFWNAVTYVLSTQLAYRLWAKGPTDWPRK